MCWIEFFLIFFFFLFNFSIYSDVAPCLKKWSEDGRRVFIYSSGSVEAQKLLFKNTEEGDMLEFLSGHYDTEVGPKTESSSYSSIAKSIGVDSEQILFLTDVVKGKKEIFLNTFRIFLNGKK